MVGYRRALCSSLNIPSCAFWMTFDLTHVWNTLYSLYVAHTAVEDAASAKWNYGKCNWHNPAAMAFNTIEANIAILPRSSIYF